MQSSKLIKVLKTLSSEEWSSFRKYLLMHTGRTSDNFKMFEILQTQKKRLDSFNDQESFRLQHFPQMNSKGLSNLMSRLFLWLEEWLVFDTIRNNKIKNELSLHKIYNDRSLFDMADNLATKIEKQIDKNKKISLEHLRYRRQLLHQSYYSENPSKYKRGGQLITDLTETYLKIIDAQTNLYKIEIFNIGRILQYDVADILNKYESLDLKGGDKIAEIADRLWLMVKNNDVDALNYLKVLLFEGQIMAPSELHTLLTLYLLSESLKMSMNGTLEDPNTLSQLYDFALEHKYFFVGAHIPMVRFHNIVSILSGIKPFNEITMFIDKWYTYVETKNPSDTKSLAMAQNYFHHEKYEKIIDCIRGIEFQDNNQKFRSIGLQAIALFKDDTLDRNIVLNQLKNFRRVIERFKNKVSSKFYLSHLNLIKLLKALENNKYKTVTIDLKEYTPLLYKKWFENELKK